ncbi:MAG: class I SAM-dependent methyltransferase [Bacillota bacterium]
MHWKAYFPTKYLHWKTGGMDVDHYFSSDPSARSQKREIAFETEGMTFRFVTEAGVFSKARLDTGTRVLLKAIRGEKAFRILDLGCGYGPLGIVMGLRLPESRVDMVDPNGRAVELTRGNISLNGCGNCHVYQGQGFAPLQDRSYDLIITNPPIRAGKKVVYGLIGEAHRHLTPGGRLYAVIRTSQGAKSLARKLSEIFGNVEELEIESGFRVYRAVRK